MKIPLSISFLLYLTLGCEGCHKVGYSERDAVIVAIQEAPHIFYPFGFNEI